MKKQSILKKKKRFHILKKNLYQNGKAKNMMMAAIRLVVSSFKFVTVRGS